jgi:Protein of unknown function (DUF1573)
MADEFETVTASRADRAREIEVMRAHYRRHRESLKRMAADAPTDALAQEYQRLVMGIDGALGKLDELEGIAPTPRLKTEPGMTPLTQPLAEPVFDDDATHVDYEPPESPSAVSNSRLALIVGAGILVLAVIGWLIWKASSDRGDAAAPVAGTDTTATVAETTIEPATETIAGPVDAVTETAATEQLLAVQPPSHDYGVIRKGTRATRQYEVHNTGTEAMVIVVARSACRCLYYEHRPSVPAGGRETVTVTIDGAKAPSGVLSETVKVSSKVDPKIVTSFDVTATIR